MKIGILTLAQETNYGGILQAFAMQKVLKSLGHTPYTVDRHRRRCYANFRANLIGFLHRVKLRYVNHKNVSVSWIPFMPDEVYRIISAKTRDFVRRNMSMTRECYFDELEAIDKEYMFDAYVVGSDQVWLPNYYRSSFLAHVDRPDVTKVTYAASCSKRSFLDVKGAKEGVKALAATFSGISVREDTLIQRMEKYLGRTPIHVLDPTMLLCPQDYLDVTENNVEAEPVVFCYILDESKKKDSVVSAVSSFVNLPSVSMRPPQTYIKGKIKDVNACVYPAIDDWIHNINRAKFVITDSFHGTVFAILFNKPFIAIANRERGLDRFLSLLRMFHLENRLLLDINKEDVQTILNSDIDYNVVNSILAERRTQSIEFLSSSLSK
ncbi:MAG: polysaccharide pyruvyl transferase family protein [Bacteroidia bacterium]|nr:polysaccharide pyruvyl transferase family protein [Bacteroidia bacterium]